MRGHVFGMTDRAAEGKGPLAGAGDPLPMGRISSLLRRHCRLKGCGIEAPVPPRDRCEVDRVGDTPVVEGSELFALDTVDQVAPVRNVVTAEGEQICTVEPFRGRSQPEQEPRLEVAQYRPVRACRGVVEL